MSIDQVRYQRLGYLALNVSNLAASQNYYENLKGLQVDEPARDGVLFLRCSDRHHDLVLYEGGEPGLKRAAWQMESDAALDALLTHLVEIGIATVPVSDEEAAFLQISRAFRMTEPTTGAVLEFYVDMASAPSSYVQTHTKITRLGHVVLNSTDRDATEKFFREHLNFRVSDRIGTMVSFMRAFPNPLHHTLGVGAGETCGLNHINFMVTELADIGKAANRMKQAGVDVVFGIGKHPPSESYFIYFLDPDGMTTEYSFGMEEFPEVGAREPRMMPPQLESLDYWGGIPDMRFAKQGKLEPLR